MNSDWTTKTRCLSERLWEFTLRPSLIWSFSLTVKSDNVNALVDIHVPNQIYMPSIHTWYNMLLLEALVSFPSGEF